MAAHVFAYGSLMYAPVWQQVVGGRYHAARASATGFQRQAVRGETYPGVVRAAGGLVLGRLYFDVRDEDLARLDDFEGADYQRVSAELRLLDDSPSAAAGGAVRGDLYLYLDPGKLTGADWDQAWFEREGITGFMATYCRPRGSG